MKHIIPLLVILLSISTFSYAQNANNPWITGFGTNAISNPVRMQTGDQGRFETFNWDAGGLMVSFGRQIKNKISFETIVSLNNIGQNFGNTDANLPYISADGMFKYNFKNGLTFVDPYVTIGGGYTWLDTIGAGTVNGGVGVNFWLGTHFGLNLQSVYKHAFEEYGLQHFQHSFGIKLRLGGVDTDKDGINDKDDACPELFGTIAANGCPDSDGDGVVDSEDLCPETFGPTYYRGCPDRDGDGTPDKYDQCPDEPGEIDDDGCPFKDFDGDGIDDRKDKCPQQAGPANNRGCPIAQQQIKPQNPLVNAEREKLKQQLAAQLNAQISGVKFENGNATLTANDKVVLDKLAATIIPLVKLKFHIAGHTDNTGDATANMELSKNRALAVRDYLLSKGMTIDRLTAKGYGQDNPIADNTTEEGRAKNRRVEIFLIE
ncbi:OmpA family protein [Lacinutrix salivirga]